LADDREDGTVALQTILVIEDDAAIRRGLRDALDFSGYGVVEAVDGPSAVQTATRCDVDLLLLDLNLPGCDGMEVLRQVRQSKPTVPVIILSARGGERDRVTGLRIGADDYVVKPFSIVELLARVEAVLRRTPARPLPETELTLPGGRVDVETGDYHMQSGEHRHFSERERDLLRYLVENPGRVVSRDELLSRVWHVRPEGVTTRTVDMQVARLRDKLRATDEEPDLIHTIRGKGYRYGCKEVAW
jgi:DNA-binding response OmpR family regulator